MEEFAIVLGSANQTGTYTFSAISRIDGQWFVVFSELSQQTPLLNNDVTQPGNETSAESNEAQRGARTHPLSIPSYPIVSTEGYKTVLSAPKNDSQPDKRFLNLKHSSPDVLVSFRCSSVACCLYKLDIPSQCLQYPDLVQIARNCSPTIFL